MIRIYRLCAILISLVTELFTSEMQSAANAIAIVQVEPDAEHIISTDAPKKDHLAELVLTHGSTLPGLCAVLVHNGTTEDELATKVNMEKNEINNSFIKRFFVVKKARTRLILKTQHSGEPPLCKLDATGYLIDSVVAG